MYWILILIMVGPDATWTGYTYPDQGNEGGPPQHFTTEAECQQYGADMVDGDGDNEHAVCAPISI